MPSMMVKWHYYQHGDPSKFPVLFLHGFMAHGKVWLPTMETLPEKFFSIAPDLPGHGKTSTDLTQLTFDTVSDAVADFVTDRLSRPPVLFGYSMGGRIALYTALKYPEKFCALVLESSSPGIENQADKEERLGEDQVKADKLRNSDIRTYLTDWYKLPVFSSLARRPDLVEGIIQKKSSNAPAALAEVIVRLSPGQQPSLWDKLDQWNKPTLVMAGEMDEKFCEIARKMAPKLKKAELKIIPDAGHIVHLENGKEFVAALNFFLSSLIL